MLMMTLERSTGLDAESVARARDFDYGVDDPRSTEVRIRAEIAARIREAGRLDAGGTLPALVAYERAARIAEGLEH
jgi:hypothetical protein